MFLEVKRVVTLALCVVVSDYKKFMKGEAGLLVRLCFLIRVLAIQVYSVYENSPNCTVSIGTLLCIYSNLKKD